MKKLLLVIVLMLVAVVFVSSPAATSVNPDLDRDASSRVDFEDFNNSDIAPPWGPVHP